MSVTLVLSDAVLDQIAAHVIAKLPTGQVPIVAPPPVVTVPTYPVAVPDDKTAIVTYQRGLPGSRPGSMDVLFMTKPVLSVAFRTRASGRGWITRVEYVGNGWQGDSWISILPNTWDPSVFGDSYSPPQTNNSLRVCIGETVPGFFTLPPNSDFFYNVRAQPWSAEIARDQFSVNIGVAQ